jgi:DNA-binding NtrC family response regulator
VSRRVLIVDDDPAIRELLVEFLSNADTELTQAATGAEALESFAAAPPDIVLLDMRLPDTDGLDVLSAMRTRPDIPVVVITADSGSSRTIRAVQGGAYDYLIKPLELDAVQHIMDRALEHVRLSETVKTLAAKARTT